MQFMNQFTMYSYNLLVLFSFIEKLWISLGLKIIPFAFQQQTSFKYQGWFVDITHYFSTLWKCVRFLTYWKNSQLGTKKKGKIFYVWRNKLNHYKQMSLISLGIVLNWILYWKYHKEHLWMFAGYCWWCLISILHSNNHQYFNVSFKFKSPPFLRP